MIAVDDFLLTHDSTDCGGHVGAFAFKIDWLKQ